ncbi:hypothetical protein [Solimonas sp. SE-A11]|uniref:hypothetical protein n=1 Tax=Solimonas sp. SE-A11 TaxID=3054954 RepID=UPI00259C96C7|nr:hypothetical protein [Solimonas sp. SE-A11]MDM4772401.1 hypothetical protein [Solimonas sp. SE-A11]
MKQAAKACGLAILMLVGGCTGHRFVATGVTQAQYPAKPKNCGAKVLLRPPEGIRYTELGICMAKAPGGGMISDNTPDAIEELQRCACLQGGDGIILGSANEAGVMPAFGGYSQQVAKAQGVVVVFER